MLNKRKEKLIIKENCIKTGDKWDIYTIHTYEIGLKSNNNKEIVTSSCYFVMN